MQTRIYKCVLSCFAPERRGYLLAWLAGIALACTTLGLGFFADDFLLYLTLHGDYDFVAPLDAFQFISTDPDTARAMIDAGPFPWFTDPEMKIRFFRPLTALTMLFDVQVFQHTLPLYHLHSIAWYALFLAAAALCYRRIFPGNFGMLVFLLFVLNESNYISAAWWANRNAPLAAGFAFLGLAAHLRWRENGWRPGLPLSLLAYTLGLLGGETALSVLAYVAAYELAGNAEPLFKRLRCLSPAAALSVGYLLFYKAIGCGVRGSGIYLDPVANPLAYFKALPLRLVHFYTTNMLTMPFEPVQWLPWLYWPFTFLGLVALAILVFIWRKASPGMDPVKRRSIRWLALGALLSALPVLSMAPAMRLLLIPSFGGVALIMMMIEYGWNRRTQHGSLSPAALVAYGLIVLHFLVAPLLWPAQTCLFTGYAQKAEQASLDAEIDNTKVAGQYVMVMSMENPLPSFIPMLVRWYHGLPHPKGWRFLSSSPYPHRYTRTAPNVLELKIKGHALGEAHFERLFRAPSNPLRKGDCIQLTEMQVDILDATPNGATHIRFTFAQPLESEAYLFLYVKDNQLLRWSVPAQGESDCLPAQGVAYRHGLFP